MVSTFLSYRTYTADVARSVALTLSDAQVSREQTYYRENIGKVTSVDEFLKDQRLYAYAMKAYGLEDMTYAKAFMRKVLESDLTDSQSFAGKLTDKRYVAFAKAFNFTTTGATEKGAVSAQDDADETETVGLYSEQRVRKGATAATEAEYYEARIGTIKTVDQLVSDSRLFSYALTAYGIDPDVASETTIRNVLKSDLSDPDSVANKLGDARYTKLAEAFSFDTDGKVPDGGQAQSDAQLNQTILLNYEETGNDTTPAAAAFKTDYFREAMASVTSVDDLVDDSVLRAYVATAVGLDPTTTSAATLRSVLTSDKSDSSSLANSSDSYRTLAAAFNFNTDGSLDDGTSAQSAAQEKSLTDLYLANYDKTVLSNEQTQSNYYKLKIDTVASIDDLLGDAKLFSYVLQAYGLDASEESKSKIKQVLESNPEDSNSFARRLGDARYTKLAAAFNFGSDGLAKGGVLAQIASSKSATISLYSSKQGTSDTEKTLGTAESKYYSETIDKIQTVDDFLKDKRLVAYVKKAYGFDKETISDDVLRQALTSDVFDLKSFVNSSANIRFRDLASAFNFGADGKATRVDVGKAQDKGELVQTQDLYVRQKMETDAGKANEGVRLALYFQRKASTITSGYSVLADKALLQVVSTALSLPDSGADVDAQAKLIAKKVDFADFKDPAKVEKFIARFAALYDIQNPQSSTTSIPSLLLGQGETPTIGIDLLTSIQSTKLGV